LDLDEKQIRSGVCDVVVRQVTLHHHALVTLQNRGNLHAHPHEIGGCNERMP